MDKFNKGCLKDIKAVRLDHKILYRVDDELIEQRHVNDVAELLDALDGSRVGLYMVPYDDKSGVFLQLRCGELVSSKLPPPEYLSSVIELAPFIAACAGKEEPKPSELDDLKRRVSQLEKLAGIEAES